MQQVEEHIRRINTKLQEMLKKFASLSKEAELNQKIIKDLKQQNEEMKMKMETLQQQHHILKSAAGKMDEGDRKAFELVLNKYIREIDKSINFLNG